MDEMTNWTAVGQSDNVFLESHACGQEEFGLISLCFVGNENDSCDLKLMD